MQTSGFLLRIKFSAGSQFNASKSTSSQTVSNKAIELTLKKNKMENINGLITLNDFSKIEIRVGTIISAELFKEAKKPAYKILIDFGEFGIKKTSAQITKLYIPEEIIGKQVIAVTNFPTKQIANIQSECLVLGAVDKEEVTLLTTDKQVKNGLRIG